MPVSSKLIYCGDHDTSGHSRAYPLSRLQPIAAERQLPPENFAASFDCAQSVRDKQFVKTRGFLAAERLWTFRIAPRDDTTRHPGPGSTAPSTKRSSQRSLRTLAGWHNFELKKAQPRPLQTLIAVSAANLHRWFR